MSVAKLKDVNAAVEIGEVYNCFWSKVVEFQHFFPNKAVNLEAVRFIVVFLKIEIDNRSGGIGVEFDDSGHCGAGRAGNWSGLAFHANG